MSELEVRASDAERERVSLALREACGEGRLTLDELSQRVDRLYAASSRAELDELTRDLPAAPPPARRRAPTRLTISIFGDFVRRGRWRLGRRTFALCVFGNIDLDLRGAEIDRDRASILVLALFGNVDVYVPEAVDVDAGGLVVFGHRREWGRDDAVRRDAPLVRVRVLVLFGTVDVWRVPPGAGGSYRDVIRLVKSRQRELGR